MNASLTVHNAEIRTATVEIKSLTVSGKQVTQSVFRQLQEMPLIAYDGTLNGVPWGRVNYHPDKCGDSRTAHWHVVWQDGTELRRSTTSVEPSFQHDEIADADPEHWPAESSALFAAAVHHWLETGEVIGWRSPLFELFTGLKASLYSHSSTEQEINTPDRQREFVKNCLNDFSYKDQQTGLTVGVEVSGEVKEALLATIALRAAAEHDPQEDHYGSEGEETSYCWCPSCKELKLAAGREKVTATREALASSAAGFPAPEMWTSFRDELAGEVSDRAAHREAEASRRQRHREVHQSIAGLPQLFIAV